MAGMGIAILFMLFVCMAVVASFVTAAVVSFGLIPLAYYIRKTPKERRIGGRAKTLIMLSIGTGFSALAIVLGFYGGRALMSMSGGPAPLKDGRSLVCLPPEAEVTKVEYGDWAGDFVVEFRLPTTRATDAWLSVVWKLNESKQKDFQDFEYRQEANSIGIYCHGVARMSIAYDPNAQVYRFEHYFES